MGGLEAGSALGGYRILARLRAGAMGVLYLARRNGAAGFVRPVAIKVIHDHLAKNRRFCRMFIAEAKLSANIDDPHVVRVEEFGEADGRYYIVMEYVHGVSLAQALGVLRGKGGIPLDVAVAIAMSVASGLHAAHEAADESGAPLGIVHRDVSPHNVLVSYKGWVKVIDFGIAKAKESVGQTRTGSLRGKLAYMAPEQARSAKHVDRRADLYALGLVLWEMLTGRRVFDGESDLAILNQIRSPVIVAPSEINPTVPAELDAVVLGLLAQDPDGRPPTGSDVARLLGEAFPDATRVLPADVAAVMEKVRVTATSEDENEADAGGSYGAEVRKGLATFSRSMGESVEGAEGVLEGLASSPDLSQQETEVMMKPPVSLEASAGPYARPHPRPTAEQARTVIQEGNPYLTQPPLLLPFGLRRMPAWVTPPVLVLAASTAALAAALVVVECGRHGSTPLDKARDAASVGDSTEVRRLLEARVRAGHGTVDEARLVRAACKQMADVACSEQVAQLYPDTR